MNLQEKIPLHRRSLKSCIVRRNDIVVHDLRHSQVSLLIELDFSPLLIAERLGHENIETTLNTYSHLYPNKQSEVANSLQELSSTISVPDFPIK